MAWAKRALLIAALGGLSMMARPAVAQQDHGWRGPEGHARFEGRPGGWAYGRRDDVRAWGFAGEHRPGWDWRGAWNRESWAWDSLMVGVAAGFIIAPPVLFGPPPPTGDGRAEGSGAAMTAKV